jgi:DNA processing protein
MLTEKHFWLGFNIFPGIGPKRFIELLKRFGSAKLSWFAPKDELVKTSIPHSIVDRFIEFREKLDLNTEMLRVEKGLIKVITLEDKSYPINLSKIHNPPPVLYVKGRLLPQDSLALAVVGTRKVTAYGQEVTEKLVGGLVERGFTIVSGLARGVDSLAHRIALGNRGRTIAILGNGLDRVYPPEHRALAEKIVNTDQGALISQVPLDIAPLKGNFPSRNRLISGLCLGTLVIEGASKSGTQITSEYSQQQGRPVFAVPGPITSSLSDGPAELIKNGARLVTKVEDILSALKVSKGSEVSRVSKVTTKMFKSKEEERIWQLLVSGSKHIDEIIRQSGLPSEKTLSCLTTMELTGMVKNIGGGNYIIN